MASGPREEIDALAAEGAKVSAFLRGLDDTGWKTQTRCPPWDVREIVIHMTTMMRYMSETAAGPFLSVAPAQDRASWWDYDIDEDQAATLEFVEDATTRFPDGPIYNEWRESIDRVVAAVIASLENGDPVVKPGDNPILMSEYVATRVLEITIHQMDVRDAFRLAPDPSPEGIAVTLGILGRRLGADPLALGFDGVDFILLSTGRRTLADEDRARLGDRAALLPLLA